MKFNLILTLIRGNAAYGTAGQYPSSYNNYPQAGGTVGAYQASTGTYPSNYSAQPGYEPTPDYSHSKLFGLNYYG